MDSTRQQCPIDGVTWQLDLRESGSAALLEGRLANGGFQTTVLDATRLRRGAWSLRAVESDSEVSTETGLPAPGLTLECSLDGDGLHCAGSDEEDAWEIRFFRAPTSP